MSIVIVEHLLKQVENIRLEFKEAKTALPGNLFETICAMLNREGGDILLGVDDNGAIGRIDPEKVAMYGFSLSSHMKLSEAGSLQTTFYKS